MASPFASPDSFPRQYARTRRFSLGEPRAFRIAPDGRRIAFLRSGGGSDPQTSLWTWEAGTATERLAANPVELLRGRDGSRITDAERARRERVREQADGVTAFATDDAVSVAAFALAGRLFATDLAEGTTRALAAADGGFDPRPSPDGGWVAYVSNQCLRLVGLGLDEPDRLLAGEDDDDVSWGVADFIASEELSRIRGFWWSPDSAFVAATRVDVAPVAVWHIGDPADPARVPVRHRYPVAGTANAEVSLAVIDVATGASTAVEWDRVAFPYLVEVVWVENPGLVIVVSDRSQRTQQTLRVDHTSGVCVLIDELTDDAWVELAPGTPAFTDDGRMVAVRRDDATDTNRVYVAGVPISPPGVQIRRVLGVRGGPGERIVASAHGAQPWFVTIWRNDRETPAGEAVTEAVVGDDLWVQRIASLDADRATVSVWREAPDGALSPTAEIRSLAETPLVAARPSLILLAARAIPAAVLLPSDPVRAAGPLPVLLDPYGGPHAQRVLATRAAHSTSQWLADEGFAVVVIDGRGTPGKGPRWERAVRGDLASPVLEDQIDGLHAAARRFEQLDLTRVAIRGWSFGGYLAALAVLRAPDVFHAAIAGAPVTDWRLYDTAYSERYLGHPDQDPEAYDRTSLLLDAARLTRPLLLVHGLADDNVVAAHTLRLSSALLAGGRPHEVLPLSGVTHMTPQEVVAENLLLLQVAFLRRALGIPLPAG